MFKYKQQHPNHLKFNIPIPLIPSIADLTSQELRNPTVTFKVLRENLQKIAKVDGDGNYGYYAIFESFEFMGKDRADKKQYSYKQKYPITTTKRMELVKFGKNVDSFVHHHDATVPPKVVQLLPEGHSHLFGLNAPNLKTRQDRIDAFMATIGNSVYTKEFDNNRTGLGWIKSGIWRLHLQALSLHTSSTSTSLNTMWMLQ